MAVLQMQRISLCALKKDRKAILDTLQRRGVVEISDVALEENDNFFQKSDTVQAKQGFDRNVTLANQALDVLDTYAPVKTSMLSMFEGRTPVTVQQFQMYPSGLPARKKRQLLLVLFRKCSAVRRFTAALHSMPLMQILAWTASALQQSRYVYLL